MSDGDLDPTQAIPAQPLDPTYGGAGLPPTAAVPSVPPPPPPPDRRPWIIAALLALIALVLLLILVFQDDGDDSDESSTSTSELTTSSSSSSTSSSSTTSTTAATTTTTEPSVVTVPPEECANAGKSAVKPGLMANAVYDAWVRGDKACAAELMTPAALNELFSRDGTDANDQFQGCSEEELPDPHTDCAFSFEGGATHYLANFSDTDGWKVYDITQVAD